MRFRDRAVVPGAGPFIFGVLNVTPDSFSDGGRFASAEDAVAAGCRLAEEGADVIDVGGESTRPGSEEVPAEEQIRRTQPVIASLSRQFGTGGPAISIDTRSAAVAEAAIAAGAGVVNDISALRHDRLMAGVVARHGVGVVLMHMQGTPAHMQNNPRYADVVGDVIAFLAERMAAAVAAGIRHDRLIVDPGIGFGKTVEHNLALLRRVAEFRKLGVPVLVGPSRKRFIAQVTASENVADRLPGTIAAVCACVLAGIEIVRVHDVLASRRAADLCAAIRGPRLE